MGDTDYEDLRLASVPAGEVEYLAVFAYGRPVSKGAVDFAKEPGAASIWQVATHPRLEGLGLATRLIGELEARAARRGVDHIAIGVEPHNERAYRLYQHLGDRPVGESESSWEAERRDGSRFTYTTRIIEMAKVAS